MTTPRPATYLHPVTTSDDSAADILDLEAGAESKPFVEAGVYVAYSKTAKIVSIPFGREHAERFVITFEIRGGRYDGVELCFYAPAPPLVRGRREPVRDGSKLYRAWTVALNRKPLRGERPRLDLFRHKIFRVRVRVVERDRRQGKLHTATRYSVVDALEERDA